MPGAQRLTPGLKARRIALGLLAAAYVVAGTLHWLSPAPFLAITPDWVPHPETVIRATGACEIAGALGLLHPRTRRLAGVLLALYAVCVFPANLRHAFGGVGPDLGWAYHAPRLALQPVIVWWTLWASEVIDWPFVKRSERRRRRTCE